MAKVVSIQVTSLLDSYSRKNALECQMDITYESRIWWTLWIKTRRETRSYIRQNIQIWDPSIGNWHKNRWIVISTGKIIIGNRLEDLLTSARLRDLATINQVHSS